MENIWFTPFCPLSSSEHLLHAMDDAYYIVL